MSTVPPMEDPDNLARVGTEEAGFPEGGEPSQSNESASQAKKNAWPSSAKEELDKFKGVPVVGGLPWRTQYLVLAGVLALSLLGLMGLLTRGGDAAPNPGAVVQARESVKQITTQVDLLARGGVADPAILAEAQKRGGAAAKPLADLTGGFQHLLLPTLFNGGHVQQRYQCLVMANHLSQRHTLGRPRQAFPFGLLKQRQCTGQALNQGMATLAGILLKLP